MLTALIIVGTAAGDPGCRMAFSVALVVAFLWAEMDALQ